MPVMPVEPVLAVRNATPIHDASPSHSTGSTGITGQTGLTLLFFHGNAGNISHRLDKLRLLNEQGFSVFIFDYRGYGQSAGVPSEQGTYADAEAAYRYLTLERQIPSQHIVFYGESLGCAVATEMAARHAAAALVLESPFTSTVAMGKRAFPWLPVEWIVRYRYDTLAKISTIKTPLLILHSRQDEIVPFAMGLELLSAAPSGRKHLVELTGDHNEGFLMSGPRYTNALNQFVASLPKGVQP
jgi:fermentation-respiration switch protein FrsA (DUF1100 family)